MHNYLHNSKKSSTFARFFAEPLNWGPRKSLEMRYTHYVVSGVRIPHSPQSVEFGKLHKRQKRMRVFALIFFVDYSAC